MHRRGKGQNRNIPCPLNGNGYFSLVFGTISGDPSRDDLSSFCNEITKDPCILIVDLQFFIGAESTDLSPQERFLFSISGRLFSRSPHVFLLSLWIHFTCGWPYVCSYLVNGSEVHGDHFGTGPILSLRSFPAPLVELPDDQKVLATLQVQFDFR
jgi:hypothetical protein